MCNLVTEGFTEQTVTKQILDLHNDIHVLGSGGCECQ